MKTKRVRHLLLLALLGANVLGCNATGWEPGPLPEDRSSVPTPIGTILLSGERDTVIEMDNVDGKNTTTIPSIDRVRITRLASGPLQTRGERQYAIEDMRWERAISNFERAADKLNAIATQWAPLMQTYYPPPSAQTAPKPVDEVKAAIAEAVKAALADAISQSRPAPQAP